MVVRRDKEATRARLLDAARRRFAEHGYAGTSVRAVAGDAGVDAALVFRYFGSKDGLFVAATADEDPERLRGLPPEEFAERLLSMFAYPPEGARPVAALLRSGGRAAGEARLQAAVCGPYLDDVAGTLDGEDPELRAELLVAWVLGVAVMRGLVPGTLLGRTDPDALARYSRAVVRALVDEPEGDARRGSP
ncbi:TetR family transcriptional regulator [Isoptericola sp. F-RaC21]|uniref:TetR/AcrR family transcriptional regulator n=1 Tax=Isoptericola sp. F-RaC21 TaxID=3141452 RepID=UPI00315B9202